MIIKRCGIDQFEEIYKIEESSFSNPMKRETIKKDLERESYFCYALFIEEPVAFVSFEKVFDEGQIMSVATMPRYRGKGYARRIFDEILTISKAEGIEFFTLEVRSDNTPAIKLYQSIGFKEVGRRKNYYTDPLCDAILMDFHIGKE